MSSNVAPIAMTADQIEEQKIKASRYVRSVRWSGGLVSTPPQQPIPAGDPLHTYRMPMETSNTTEHQASLLEIARKISKDDVLINDDINHVLGVLRTGLQIGLHLSTLYVKASGLEVLTRSNRTVALMSSGEQAESRAKQVTASAVMAFCTAAYVTWELSTYRSEEVSGVDLQFGGIPELVLKSPLETISCVLYYYAAYLEKSGVVRTSLDVLKMTLLYFRAVIDEIKMREGSLQYKEPFTDNCYKLEKSDFSVLGFSVESKASHISIAVNRIEEDDIVGNRDAKHMARRLTERMLCYDPLTQQNPMYKLRALPIVSMGCGLPGGGKSMMIGFIATLLGDKAKEIGVPFLFWPMPDNIVSSYQGTTSERMSDWMKVLRDPTKIMYAPIDDAESRFQDRSHEHISEGGRSVVETFLRNSEGASAVWHGNAVLQFYTNYPEQLDAAVLSRVMARTYINGAESWQDFLDQDQHWWKMYAEFDPTFVGMEDPKDYEYFSSQRRMKSISEISASLMYPEDEHIREIFERAKKNYSLKEHRFFGEFFAEIKKSYSFFSSRDVRNIQQAVSERVMDFDLPDEWHDLPEVFYRETYDQKMIMIVDLMRQNMKGLSFADIRLQETIRYVSTAIKIQEAARERKIKQMVEDALLRNEAQKRLHALLGKE